MSSKRRAIRATGWVLAAIGLLLLIDGLLPIPDPRTITNAAASDGAAWALFFRPYVLAAGGALLLTALGLIALVRRSNREEA